MAALSFGGSVPSLDYPTGSLFNANHPMAKQNQLSKNVRYRSLDSVVSGLSKGSTYRSMDSAVSSAQRSRRATNTAYDVPLSYGSSVASVPTRTSKTKLGFGSFLSGITSGLSGNSSRVHSKVDYALGTPVGSALPASAGVDLAQHIDGGARNLSSLKALGQQITGALGSSGDGDIIPASYGGTAQGGGIDPAMIAIMALAAGVVVYAVTK